MPSSDCRRGIHWRCSDNGCTCTCPHDDGEAKKESEPARRKAAPVGPVRPRRFNDSDDDLVTGIFLGAIFL